MSKCRGRGGGEMARDNARAVMSRRGEDVEWERREGCKGREKEGNYGTVETMKTQDRETRHW